MPITLITMIARRDGVRYGGRTYDKGAKFPATAEHGALLYHIGQAVYAHEVDRPHTASVQRKNMEPTPEAEQPADVVEQLTADEPPRKRGRPKGSGKGTYKRRDMTTETPSE